MSRPRYYLLSFVCLLILICLGVQQSISQNDSLNRKVTAKDMPRIPHTPASKALSTFKVANGFKLELVAAEPMVSDPVDACFDEFGRMYVAEMHGYPFSQEPTKLNPKGGGKKDAGIIRLLEDTNGDGRMDKSVVFADKISWPTSVCCYNGGVFVLAPENLYYFKDTDGDNKADVREVILSGFGRGNVQSVANCLKWSLDNRIIFAAGRNPKRLKHRGKTMKSVQSGDLRFDPKTEHFDTVTGGQQFGHSMDDWGTRFVCSNSNHIQQVIFPQGYLARNPYFAASGLIRSIAADGASARVFRISPPEPWRIIRQKWRALAKGYKLVINDDGGWEFIPLDPSKKKGAVPTEYPVGFFTSATGITIYRGDAYPAEYRGNAFIGDVGGNLVHRKIVETEKVIYRAKRADQKTEMIRSTDNWYRPVNFVNAPDGTLYVLDMYRETIEHPHSIPVEIKQFLDLTSGHDRGRIYRLVSPGTKRIQQPNLGKLTNAELITQLASDNGWTRVTAQRLLWERQDRTIIDKLEKFLQSTKKPLGRLHALYTLQGLNALKVEHIQLCLKNVHPRVRAHAVRLSESLQAKSPELIKSLSSLVEDDSEHVRFQLAFSLGTTDHVDALKGLAQMAMDSRNGPEIRTAILTSVGNTADKLATILQYYQQLRPQKHVNGMLLQLAKMVGANPKRESALRLLNTATDAKTSLEMQQLLLTGLGQGLSQRGASMTDLLSHKSTTTELRKQVANLFERATQLAENEKQTIPRREAALRLLAYADFKTASQTLPKFLSPQTPQTLQKTAIEALAEQESDQIVEPLLAGWKGYSPAIRRSVIDALLTKPGRILTLLKAIAANMVKRSDIERTSKQLLMNHANKQVRAASQKIFAGEINSDRAKVVKAYQKVLTLNSNVMRGLEVFKKRCAVCHQVGNIGHQIAPDLSSVQNKSESDLLISILDPNREAQPNFNVYNVTTLQGRTFTGIIKSETTNSITLQRAEGKEDVILRSNIDELFSTGVSLMPEGLEKDLTAQELADVIAFVKSIKPQKSTQK